MPITSDLLREARRAAAPRGAVGQPFRPKARPSAGPFHVWGSASDAGAERQADKTTSPRSAHTPQPPVAVSIVAGAWSGRDCAHGTAHHRADRPSHNGPRSHSGCRAHGLALGGTGGNRQTGQQNQTQAAHQAASERCVSQTVKVPLSAMLHRTRGGVWICRRGELGGEVAQNGTAAMCGSLTATLPP